MAKSMMPPQKCCFWIWYMYFFFFNHSWDVEEIIGRDDRRLGFYVSGFWRLGFCVGGCWFLDRDG
jgi:hypothetical protein